MSHTPEQAKELWCPMVRGIIVGCGPAPCIADKCAMWRWEPSKTTHAERRVIDTLKDGTGFDHDMQFVAEIVQVPDAPTHGYCGISGRPEVTL